MKSTIFAFVAAAGSVAAWQQYCSDISLDVATETISAKCDTGDGQGTLNPTSLDLNTCFGFENNAIVVRSRLTGRR